MADRRSGILLHVSSLPSPYGIGDLGPAAYRFIDFLYRTGQGYWQVLPIGPIGYGGSPYQSPSAFAGNALFISLERLVEQGLLTDAELADGRNFPDTRVDFERVPPWRHRQLMQAYAAYCQAPPPDMAARVAAFRQAQARWLEEYALFIALKEAHDDAPWTSWEPELVRRDPAALADARQRLARRIDAEVFFQFLFAEQWSELKRYAAERGVRILGDIPIFVAHDSADVWVNQELFYLRDDGLPSVVAGVPPDYFSASGQRWGNPLYRWDVQARTRYAWWIERLRHSVELYDLIRVDHFRGFEAYWEVPGDAPDARGGRWVTGPGMALFRAAEEQLGQLPIVAEDLGLITPAVDALREELGAPGMRVLQFAFGADPKAADYEPHNYPQQCVVYTGTHDNDTVIGWFHNQSASASTRSPEDVAAEQARVLTYLGTDGSEIHWDIIRLAWASVASLAIAPLQDVLGLGTEARMNLPGSSEGNWGWRFIPYQLTLDMEERLRKMTEIYDRKSIAPIDRDAASQSD